MLIERLKRETRKHPEWKKLFLKWIKEDNDENIQKIINSFLLCQKHKHKLKKIITPIKVSAKIEKNKNENPIKIYCTMVNDEVKNISIGLEWNKESYLNKIDVEDLNINIASNNNSCNLMLEVLDYNACKALGSKKWCIVKNQMDFSKYRNKMRSQYIYLDFNKSQSENNSLIGFSVLINGHVVDSYLKNNDKTKKETINLFNFKKIKKDDFKKQNLENLSIEKKFQQICRYGSKNDFDEIIKDVSPDKYDDLAIRLASTYGNLEILNRLLEIKEVNPASLNNKAFQDAAKYGNLDIIKRLLLDKRVNPIDLNNIAFCKAAENGMLDVIEYMLDNNIGDPSVYNNRALNESMVNGHLLVANRILRDSRVLNIL